MRYLSSEPFSIHNAGNEAYGSGWDRIFGKKETPRAEDTERDVQEFEAAEPDEAYERYARLCDLLYAWKRYLLHETGQFELEEAVEELFHDPALTPDADIRAYVTDKVLPLVLYGVRK
jgi:hypothetical protein